MQLEITPRYEHSPKPIVFPDLVNAVTFGRAQDCLFRLPPHLAHAVGKHHFAIRYDGGFKFKIDSEYPVYTNGKPIRHDNEVPDQCEVQLGTVDGPSLSIRILRPNSAELAPTGDLARVATIDEDVIAIKPRVTSLIFSNLAIALVLLFLVGTVGWIRQNQDRQTAELKEVRKKLAEQYTLASRAARDSDFTGLVESYKGSIYLVTLLTENGRAIEWATAWVVDAGKGQKAFATNAHVAKSIEDHIGEAAGLPRFVLRSPGANPIDYELDRIEIHPGNGEFENQFLAVDDAEELEALRPVRMVGGYDVALLHPKKQEGIASPLPLADIDSKGALQMGMRVVALGYPSENVLGSNALTPSPKALQGSITNLTTFFFKPDSADAQLVGHSIPSTGGASGSPIFNSDGKVIALLNAGNIIVVKDIFDPDDNALTRSPHAAQLNFGQRVDLLKDLLEGKAETKLSSYRENWKNELARFAKDPVALRAETIRNFTKYVDKIEVKVLADCIPDDKAFCRSFTVSKGERILVLVYGTQRNAAQYKVQALSVGSQSTAEETVLEGKVPLRFSSGTFIGSDDAASYKVFVKPSANAASQSAQPMTVEIIAGREEVAEASTD